MSHTNNTCSADKPVTPSDAMAASHIDDEDDITWEEETSELIYSQTKNFGDLDTTVTYKVTPVKIVVRKYGPQLLIEVEDRKDPKHESFPVFAPSNYRERVKQLCGTTMQPHLLRYHGMDVKNSKKMHNYQIGKIK